MESLYGFQFLFFEKILYGIGNVKNPYKDFVFLLSKKFPIRSSKVSSKKKNVVCWSRIKTTGGDFLEIFK